jgi:hypothetical protein
MGMISFLRKKNMVFSFFTISSLPVAQTRSTTQKASITVSEISSLYDWNQKSNTGSALAAFTLSGRKNTAFNQNLERQYHFL